MPRRDPALHVQDIIDAIRRIQRYTEGMDFDAFAVDQRTMDAVIRNFTIIGEAARHVPDHVAHLYPEVPWNDMRDMKNLIVHAYFGVDEWVVWRTIVDDLPPLASALARIARGPA